MKTPALPLAARLAAARLDGAVVVADPADRPVDLAAAYAVQRDVTALLGPVSDAWKVGSTSAAAQARLGTTEPGAARVPARFRFHSGASIPVHAAHDLWVEAEFALRLGADLPPRAAPYTKADVLAAIDGVAPALEIVGSRLSGGLSGSGRLLVTADGGANVALVTGDVMTGWRAFDLPGHGVRLRRNDAAEAAGTGEQALGDPVNVLLWIANFQRLRDGLCAGALVSTGTCTGLVRVGPGDRLVGDFGDIGLVEARLTGANSSCVASEPVP